ncbi:MAG: hypothetical protein IPK16_21425 [Anaerolineales bacterium]|nr:hypothetical protein [Anaerolineales bacterium]
MGSQLNDAQLDWPVAGHHWAVQLLQRTLAPASDVCGRQGPSHAYLFLGIAQVGKTTLARAFAQALLCTQPGERPCGVCRACRLFQHGNHPDFRILQPLDKEGAVDRANGELRAEQAATIIHDVVLKPVEGQWRIFLVQDVHTANPSFLNKILKTLEEPPPQAILVLTALDRASVLPTIVSRCQTLELRPVDTATIQHALQAQWRASADQAAVLAHLANGRLGWAVDQLRFPERGQERLQTLETLWRLMAADRIERLAFAESTAASRNSRHLFSMLETWSLWWRDVLLVQAGCADACANIDQREQLQRVAGLLDRELVRSYLLTLRRIEGYLHHTVNTRLALDVLMLKLPRFTEGPVV